MKNKREKNVLKRILYMTAFVYIGYILFQQYIYLSNGDKEKNKYIAEINKQKSIAANYQKQKDLYKTDSYVEKVARDKLGMVYPGEKIFVDASK